MLLGLIVLEIKNFFHIRITSCCQELKNIIHHEPIISFTYLGMSSLFSSFVNLMFHFSCGKGLIWTHDQTVKYNRQSQPESAKTHKL